MAKKPQLSWVNDSQQIFCDESCVFVPFFQNCLNRQNSIFNWFITWNYLNFSSENNWTTDCLWMDTVVDDLFEFRKTDYCRYLQFTFLTMLVNFQSPIALFKDKNKDIENSCSSKRYNGCLSHVHVQNVSQTSAQTRDLFSRKKI